MGDIVFVEVFNSVDELMEESSGKLFISLDESFVDDIEESSILGKLIDNIGNSLGFFSFDSFSDISCKKGFDDVFMVQFGKLLLDLVAMVDLFTLKRENFNSIIDVVRCVFGVKDRELGLGDL